MAFDRQLPEKLCDLYRQKGHDVPGPASLAELYAPRPSQFLGIWKFGAWRIKAYGIPFKRAAVRPALIEATKAKIPSVLPAADEPGMPSVGFAVVHDAEDAGFVLIDWWANNIEIHQSIWYADIRAPGELLSPSTAVVACVYELEIIDFERRLWIDLLRKNAGDIDLDAYLATRFEGNI